MKKILVAILVLMLTANSYCQELTFLGIPIKGSKSDFSKELLKKGFEFIPEDEEEALSGLFLGEPCILKPQTDEKGEMQNVTAILYPDDNWSSLYVKYASMKMKLIRELGTPTKDDATFNLPIEPKTDIAKYQAVNEGKCEYQCLWFTMDIGGVSISINHLYTGQNCVLVTYLRSNAQQIVMPHLKFKGISLGETPYNFASALEQQGYTYVTKVKDTYVLTGSFAGYSNCNLYVTAAQYDNTVDHVGINFPNQTRWEYLLNTYNNLKDMLTQKYGEPITCIEKFNTSNTPTSEYKIMSLLKQDEFKYETVFFIEGGYVKLIISHLYVNYEHSFYVSLIYVDGASTITTNKRAIDDL